LRLGSRIFDGDLTGGYSPIDVQRLCRAIGIQAIELFDGAVTEPAVYGEDLIKIINAECHTRGITLEQFEDVVGWRLGECMQSPQAFA